VGHKSHDPHFYKEVTKAGLMTFEALGLTREVPELAASDFLETFRSLRKLSGKIPKPKTCRQIAFFYLGNSVKN